MTPTQIQRYQWVLADLLFLPDMTPRTLDGAVVGVALVGGLVYLFSGKDRR